MSFDSDFKLKTSSPGSEPPSLTDVNAEVEEEQPGAEAEAEPETAKKSSVKFADLNDLEKLEKQYEQVMEELPPPVTTEDDSTFEPDLIDAAAAAKAGADEVIDDVAVAVQEIPEEIQEAALGLPTIVEDEGERKVFEGGQNAQIMEPNAAITAPSGNTKRLSLAEQIENQEITPDDIFNEIKVARNSLPGSGPEPIQNLHSYIISKTYSSENVVVLLNLRRMKDGDWVLDKTIAQGLKPETYGGVVSIDKYDFSEHAIQISRVSSSIGVARPSPGPSENDKDISEMLKRIEAYIASVNEKVDNINQSCSIEPGTSTNPDPNLKPIAAQCEFRTNTIPYKDMSLLDKLIGMLNALAPEDTQPSNVCEEYNMDTGSAISSWLQGLISDTFSLFGGGGGCTEAAISAALLSKSKELLDNADAQTAALIAESKDLLDKVAARKSALLSESMVFLQQVMEEDESAEETPTEPEAEVESEPPVQDISEPEPEPSPTEEPEQPPPESPPEETPPLPEETSPVPEETPPEPEEIPLPPAEEPDPTPLEIPEPFPSDEPPPLEESAVDLDLDESGSYQINIEPETDPEEFVEKHQ